MEARLSQKPLLGKRDLPLAVRCTSRTCWASKVVGQDWSSEVVALFLEDWELGRGKL